MIKQLYYIVKRKLMKNKISEIEDNEMYTCLSDGKTMWYASNLDRCNYCKNVIWYDWDREQYKKTKLCVDCNKEIKQMIKKDPQYIGLSVKDMSDSMEILEELSEK